MYKTRISGHGVKVKIFTQEICISKMNSVHYVDLK